MVVTVTACLAFAWQVSFFHDMRKSAVPVPHSVVMKIADDKNRDAIKYAYSAPRLWHRAKVEIWAECDCEHNNKKLSLGTHKSNLCKG